MKIIIEHNGQELVTYEPQKKQLQNGWYSYSLSFSYKPSKRLLSDFAIWSFPPRKKGKPRGKYNKPKGQNK